jgi:hypothetical protein
MHVASDVRQLPWRPSPQPSNSEAGIEILPLDDCHKRVGIGFLPQFKISRQVAENPWPNLNPVTRKLQSKMSVQESEKVKWCEAAGQAKVEIRRLRWQGSPYSFESFYQFHDVHISVLAAK